MILVDMGSLQMVTLHGRDSDASSVNTHYFKHLLLNRLLFLKNKFGGKYGELVLCYDNAKDGYWRKDIFPYYKAKRKEKREATQVDWDNFFLSVEELYTEILDNFKWLPINIPRLEADDIIGVMTKYYHLKENIMIVSSDGDLLQLQKFKNVRQYCPMTGKFKEEKQPEELLTTKIIKGDAKDGVPNILSVNDVFMKKTRQKPITQKKLNEWLYLEPEDYCNGEMMERYKLNRDLLSLEYIPNEYIQKVLDEYKRLTDSPRPNKVFKYLMSKKYKNLLENINQF